LRWGYPGIKRLGKTRGAVLDVLQASGGTLTIGDLANALHHKRPRDLRRRLLPPLEQKNMVECSGDTVSLTPDYLEALERRREATGEIAAETRDRERNKRKSAERRERLAGRDAQIAPSDAERAAVEELRVIAESERARRSARAQRRAMRDPRYLEPLPSLTGKIGSRVLTPRGEGELWDHKGDEARVVLDADPSEWVSVDVAKVEIMGEVA